MMFVALFVPALAAPQQEQWPLVLRGVLEGVGLGKDLDDLHSCIASVEANEGPDLHAAVELFLKKDAPDVLQGLSKLGSAFKKLPKALTHCEAAAKDARSVAPKLLQALNALKSPSDFAYHVGVDLVINQVDVFQELSAAIDAYQRRMWEAFGTNLGAALAKLLIGSRLAPELRFVALGEPQPAANATTNATSSAANASAANRSANATQLTLILEGVLEGFGLRRQVKHMEGCLNMTAAEVHLVHDAIGLLMKANAKDAVDGLQKLGEAFDSLPATIGNCTTAAVDVKEEAPRLLAALETLKHPKDFAYHVGVDLVVDHADIFNEIGAAIDSYQHQRWEEFGTHTGQALSALLVGKPAAPAVIIV
jgi:hypothetical protein